MKSVRTIFLLLLLACFAIPQTADAQIWKRVKNRAERKAQDRVERKADQTIDEALDSVEDSLEEAATRSVEDATTANDPVELNLGPNATGPADAPLVQYRQTTLLDFGPMGDIMRRMGQDLGNITAIITTDAERQQSEQEGQLSIVDTRQEHFLTINHQEETYSIRTFEDVVNLVEDHSDKAQQDAEFSFDFSANRTGKTDIFHGSKADQVLLTIKTAFAGMNPQQGTSMQGDFYTLVDLWNTTEIAGYETILAFQQNLMATLGQEFQESNFGSAFGAMGQDARLGASFKKAMEEGRKVEGLPVFARYFMVITPKDQPLDVEQVLQESSNAQGNDMASLMKMAESMSAQQSGAEVKEQTTLLTFTMHISDATAEGLTPISGDPPGGYKQINNSP